MRGCLILLMLIVGFPCLIVWRELRQNRLDVQLIAAVKQVQEIEDRDYDVDYDRDGRVREGRRLQILKAEASVIRLLSEGADPNARDFVFVRGTLLEEVKRHLKRMFKGRSNADSSARSALGIAVQTDETKIAVALLKAKARNVNATIESDVGNEDPTPLLNLAAMKGNLEIVKELCAHGADLSLLNSSKESALECALLGNGRYTMGLRWEAEVPEAIQISLRTKIFHLLLTRGASYDPNSKIAYLLLRAATEGKFSEIANELLAAGVPPNPKPEWISYGKTYSPLHWAISNDDVPLADLLFSHGASATDRNPEPPMLCLQSPEMGRLLLRHGADINAIRGHRKRSGENALSAACRSGNAKTVLFLIEHGMKVNPGGAQDFSPIEEAAQFGNTETVLLLLRHGAKFGPKSPGADALWYAIEAQKFDIAKQLLRYGAAVNAQSGCPLMAAVDAGDPEMVRELLKRGAKVNASRGEALQMACQECDEDVVKILLNHGANASARWQGETLIQVAKGGAETPGDADGIIEMLKAHGAKR